VLLNIIPFLTAVDAALAPLNFFTDDKNIVVWKCKIFLFIDQPKIFIIMLTHYFDLFVEKNKWIELKYGFLLLLKQGKIEKNRN